MQLSPIEWTHFTSNPLKYRDPDGNIVWACVHASEGCRKCYSEALTKRYGKGKAFTAPNMESLTPFLDEKELRHMLTYKPAAGKRCFVGDMTDIFGDWVPFELLDKLFAVFALRSDVTWQVLTKRVERMREYLSGNPQRRIAKESNILMRMHRGSAFDEALSTVFKWSRHENASPGEYANFLSNISDKAWPLPSVWLGCSVENQDTADRLYSLAQTPAAVRFCSYEPALSAVNFRRIEVKLGLFFDAITGAHEAMASSPHIPLPPLLPGLNWMIVGGESGPNARPMNLQWARDAREQCSILTKFFMKQAGSRPVDEYDGIGTFAPYDKRSIQAAHDLKMNHVGFKLVLLKDRKGGDLSELPAGLRCREYPPPPTVETRL